MYVCYAWRGLRQGVLMGRTRRRSGYMLLYSIKRDRALCESSCLTGVLRRGEGRVGRQGSRRGGREGPSVKKPAERLTRRVFNGDLLTGG